VLARHPLVFPQWKSVSSFAYPYKLFLRINYNFYFREKVTQQVRVPNHAAVFKTSNLRKPSALSIIIKTTCHPNMLPFNTSAFSNTLGSSDRAAQRKALIAPLKDEFDGKPEDILSHIKAFNHRCKETGVMEDFRFVEKENLPLSSVNLDDPADLKAWHANPDRFTYGNILLDSSVATIEKMQQARNTVRNALSKFSSPPDPVKMPLASKQLVSFQNREWIYTLLMTVWTSNIMKAIMQ
jgi:hypothetical protein